MAGLINKRTFIIDSHVNTRISGTDSDFNFKVEIPTSETYDRVIVLQAKIPKSYYTIPEGFNTFTLDENGVQSTITMTPACYNTTSFSIVVAQLLTAQSLINGNGWTYTVTIPNGFTTPSTGKFTYSVTAPNNPSLIMPANSSINEQFGFDKGSTNTFVASTLTSTSVVNFQQITTLLVVSDICDNGNNNILQPIFASSSPDFSTIKYQLSTTPEIASKKLKDSKSNIFNFRLCDEEFKLVNLHGQNVVYEIAIYKEQKDVSAAIPIVPPALFPNPNVNPIKMDKSKLDDNKKQEDLKVPLIGKNEK